MSTELQYVVSSFGGAVETRHNGEVRVRCPKCGHRSLWPRADGKVKVWCKECKDAGQQEGINAAICEHLTSKEPAQSPEGAVKKVRNARKGYMPRLETLRKLGVRETPGKRGSPHARVGFPHSLRDTVDIFGTTSEKIDNLKVLIDAGFNVDLAEWYQAGPKRQDVVFGNQDTFMIEGLGLVEGA